MEFTLGYSNCKPLKYFWSDYLRKSYLATCIKKNQIPQTRLYINVA